jgi:uncharacterized protein with HEPN domain
MPPSADDRLRDILSAIEKIERATRGMNVAEFTEDEIVRAATERFLGVVCEASLRLPDSIKRQGPGIDWRNMNDFANLLRHAYHSTKVDVVWDIIQNQLPPLKSFVEHRIRRPTNGA